jgi:4-amino-4-deoxy-L-arabinose transferase-like glycosyltransferase
MLIVFPILGLALILSALWVTFQIWDFRKVFLRALLVWASYTVLAVEGLSLISQITPLGLSIVWLPPILLSLWKIRNVRLSGQIRGFPTLRFPASWLDRLLVFCVILIVGITFITAWYATPNTWDSLTYHMSRVAHWAQNQSLAHFETGTERQNLMSPGAEIAISQFYVLLGGDRLANSVQWFAMLSSLVGVSYIAKKLDAGETGQIVAVVFASTLPMGIAQASSTMTDYVVSIWMVCLAVEAVQYLRSADDRFSPIFIGLSTGLAILSKPISFAYLLPFGILFAYQFLRRYRKKKLVQAVLVVLFCALILNLGYLGRNLEHYGNPVGTQGRVTTHSNEMLNWRVFLSNLLRNASLHAGTHFENVNDQLYLLLAKVHWKLGLGMSDPRTSIHPTFRIIQPSLSEDLAGNLIQALILVFVLPLALLGYRKTRTLFIYSLTVLLTFAVFSLMFKFTIFGSRYHLPFFVLCAPIVGTVLSSKFPLPISRFLAVIMVIGAWSWLTNISSRPLLPSEDKDWTILNITRETNYPGYGTYKPMIDMIKAQDCSSVGLMIKGDRPEYTLWVMMGAPDDDLEIEWITGKNSPSSAYRKPGFQPCAVICEACPEDWDSVRGLPLVFDDKTHRLFLSVDRRSH